MEKPKRVIVIGAQQIGGKEWRSVSVETTRQQIQQAKTFPFHDGLRDTDDGDLVSWAIYDGVLDSVIEYREQQSQSPMADRPPVIVLATADLDGKEVVSQLDFYHGHDYLERHRYVGNTETDYAVPDFTDLPEYGKRVAGLGMIDWYAGSFQHTIIDRADDQKGNSP